MIYKILNYVIIKINKVFIRSGVLLPRCEVCGKEHAEIHHIIHKSEGGIDLEINYKYLCSEHHRGRYGPHKNNKLDLQYKLELLKKLNTLFDKSYYSQIEIQMKLSINKSKAKKFLKGLKMYKEGYKREDIIYNIMGKKNYDDLDFFHFNDFVALNLA